MKTITRDVVWAHYQDELNPTFVYGHNSRQVELAVIENVEQLFYSAEIPFHVACKHDANISNGTTFTSLTFILQGRTDNFSHPAAIELCK
jgi:hypothetical protein